MEHAATSSACTGSCSGSGATWSTRTPASSTCRDAPADDETRRLLHRTIDAVGDDMAALEFNTAIAALMELNNRLTQVVQRARERAPRSGAGDGADARAAHAARRRGAVGAPRRVGRARVRRFPEADPAFLVDDIVEVPVQVNGKVRARVTVATGASEAEHEAAARADARSRSSSPARRCARSSSSPAAWSTSSSAEPALHAVGGSSAARTAAGTVVALPSHFLR